MPTNPTATKTPWTIDSHLKQLVEAEGLSQSEPRRYLIDYRIAEKEIAGKGSASKRRADLIKIIKALTGTEWHLSTSAWTIISKRTPANILKAMSRPLDEANDFVAVTLVSNTTHRFGSAKLSS